jgi:hypothetical protein
VDRSAFEDFDALASAGINPPFLCPSNRRFFSTAYSQGASMKMLVAALAMMSGKSTGLNWLSRILSASSRCVALA